MRPNIGQLPDLPVRHRFSLQLISDDANNLTPDVQTLGYIAALQYRHAATWCRLVDFAILAFSVTLCPHHVATIGDV